ncbi:MAG: tRNA 2-thiouridine(34) synthase MnmA [Gammaproteobacteria bacterium]
MQKFSPGAVVFVALSGGVDSALAAHLLLRAGAEVRAVFMKNWRDGDDDSGCGDKEDLFAAAAAADTLGAELLVADFAAEYRERVFAPFLRALRAGLTPNPDVYCNSEIKFAAFRRYARARGADFVATGHYARTRRADGGEWRLLKGEDSAKDQSYFLHRLSRGQLADSLFPLGAMHKADVREAARAAGLRNWSRRESMGICFIGARKFDSFLEGYIPQTPGEIRTPEGEIVGAHRGLAFYTMGQRRGLHIGGAGDAWFVVGKRRRENILVAARGANHPLLYSSRVRFANARWIAGNPPPARRVYEARLRHRHSPASCVLTRADDEGGEIVFAAPQRAAAPGQFAVVYDGNVCLGGGEIIAESDDAAE